MKFQPPSRPKVMAVEAEALDNIREAIELVLEDSMSRVKREGGKLVQLIVRA